MIRAPGLYFALSADEYHADTSLSGSGIIDLLVSPLTYWIKSVLNPDREEKSTSAQERGNAFHTRLLEGRGRYEELYAVRPEIDDYPDAINGTEALRAKCADLEIKKGGTTADLCARIQDADSDAVLWPLIKAEFDGLNDGKTIIKPDLARDIERQARIVEMHESARKAFNGGWPEVSAFWVDETGVPMKARFDYLKARAVVDLKTFTNSLGLPLDAAIARTVATYRYHVKAALYMDAVEAAKALIRDQGPDVVHGTENGTGRPTTDWLEAFIEPPAHAFVFVFLEAGAVPNVRVREFRQALTGAKPGATANLYWQSGYAAYRQGVKLYRECLAHYGPGLPWIAPEPMRPFVDDEFPIYMME